MATELTVQTVVTAGIVEAAMTAADATGNFFTNTGREWVKITNGGGSSITATFVTQGTYNVGATSYSINDLAVSVGASETKLIGPFDKALYNDANARVQITYSGVTTVTVKATTLGTA